MARPSILTPELLEKAKGYLNTCIDSVEFTDKGALTFVDVNLPSTVGLALYLGITRETVNDWSSIDSQRYNEEFSYIVKEVSMQQEQRLLNSGLGGKYQPKVVGMILSKHGYSEKVSTDITTNGQSISPDVSELTRKINELHRGTSEPSNGGAPGTVGTQAQGTE